MSAGVYQKVVIVVCQFLCRKKVVFQGHIYIGEKEQKVIYQCIPESYNLRNFFQLLLLATKRQIW